MASSTHGRQNAISLPAITPPACPPAPSMRPDSGEASSASSVQKHHSALAEELQRKSLFLSKELVAGAVAGAWAKTLIAPLDRVKITFQTSSSMSFSWGAVGSELSRVWQSDGVRGLFRGHSATLYRVMPYAAIQFATFDAIKAKIKKPGKDVPWYELLLAGAAAGAVSVAATYPLDLARARMVVGGFRQGGVWENLSLGYRKYGLVSMYRGLAPTLVGILPYAGISFATFDTLKTIVKRRTNRRDVTTPERLLFGTLSGIAGQFFTYPVDIVRRRMQTEGFLMGEERRGNGGGATAHPFKYRGVIQSLQLIIHEEGVRALWKAVAMNFVKGPIAVGVSFATHDMMIKVLK